MIEMKDALGRDLVIGGLYGYSASAGSRITVVTGTLLKLTEKKVTLEVEKRKDYLYGKILPPSDWPSAKTVSINPCHLFPVIK